MSIYNYTTNKFTQLQTITLPKFKTSDQPLALLQTQWAQILSNVLSVQILNQNTLTNVPLVTGSTNSINHFLGRDLQGWFLTRIRAAAQVYDVQDANTHPSETLALITDANVTVDIVVF